MKSFLKGTLLLLSISMALPQTGLAFTLKVGSIPAGGNVPMKNVYNKTGCRGQNISPQVRWTGAPRGTQAFALTIFDPDAPNGGKGWWHWIVYNIPPNIHQLKAGEGNPAKPELPSGSVQARNDYGEIGYGGPCPPKGNKPHRYIFTLYALKSRIQAPKDISPEKLASLLIHDKLSSAQVIAIYGR